MSDEYLRNPSSILSSLATLLCLPQLLLKIIASDCSMGEEESMQKEVRELRTELMGK